MVVVSREVTHEIECSAPLPSTPTTPRLDDCARNRLGGSQLDVTIRPSTHMYSPLFLSDAIDSPSRTVDVAAHEKRK